MLQPALESAVQIGQVPRSLVRLDEADHVACRRPGLAWAKICARFAPDLVGSWQLTILLLERPQSGQHHH